MRLLSRLLNNRSGVAMTEFALVMPFFLSFGLWGIEMANFGQKHMAVGQLASHIADNASRIGDTSTLEERKIYEEDINDILAGANLQGAKSLDFFAHGRAIVTSLEVWNPSTHSGNAHSNGVQFIHWQRCAGALNVGSSYGNQNSAQPSGIGPAGNEVQATTESPVIFVELQYDYQPLVSSAFIPNKRISATAAFMVRDSRDQSQIYKRNSTTSPSDCA
jgi:hypothetical protein